MLLTVRSLATSNVRVLVGAARRFRRSDAGIATIEFAFALPIMLMLYVYLVEFSRAFDEKRKVDRLASTISDMISQQPTAKAITSSSVGSILGASAPLMTPFAASGVTATLSVIDLKTRSDQTCCDAYIKWTFTQGGALRPCNTVLLQVPASTPPQPSNILDAVVGKPLNSAGPGELVVADVHADFQPMFGQLINLFSTGFQKTIYMSPRNSGQLILQTPASPQQGQQAQICS